MKISPSMAVPLCLLVTLIASVSSGYPQHPPTSADRVTASASGIVGVKHVGIPVCNQDHALVFYTSFAADAGAVRITFAIQDTRFPTTDVQVSATRLSFSWDLDPGPIVTCTLE